MEAQVYGFDVKARGSARSLIIVISNPYAPNYTSSRYSMRADEPGRTISNQQIPFVLCKRDI